MKKKRNHRRGGHVRAAWPRSQKLHAPKNRLARWLAKQVGPVKLKKKKHKAHSAQTGSGSGTTGALSTDGSGALWLVRSFDIPKTDSAYNRLANYSWTYDNALATFAFISVGAKAASEQLLDQLKALQRTDGRSSSRSTRVPATPRRTTGPARSPGSAWRPPCTSASTTARATTPSSTA